jgi:hypothetical protein
MSFALVSFAEVFPFFDLFRAFSHEEDRVVIFYEPADERVEIFDSPIAEPVPRAHVNYDLFRGGIFPEGIFQLFADVVFVYFDGGVGGNHFRGNVWDAEVFEQPGLVKGGVGGGIAEGAGSFESIGVVAVGGEISNSFFRARDSGKQGAFGAGMEIHDRIDLRFFYFFPELEMLFNGHFAGDNDGFVDTGYEVCDFPEIFFDHVVYLTLGKVLFIELYCGDSKDNIAKQTQSNKQNVLHVRDYSPLDLKVEFSHFNETLSSGDEVKSFKGLKFP